jgi:hypothetical protein
MLGSGEIYIGLEKRRLIIEAASTSETSVNFYHTTR